MRTTMRTLKRGQTRRLIALGVLCLLGAATAFAEGKQDFTLHNKTGLEIHELYISPHDVEDWQEDVLGQDTLADGDSLKITFSPREDANHWDLKIVDEDGKSVEWADLNLPEITDITLYYKDGKAWAQTK